MSKYLMFFLMLMVSKCSNIKNCYNDTHYKVEWNEKTKKFEEVNFDVGESLVFIKLDSCKVKDAKLLITGQIVDDSTLLNPNELLEDEALILLCNSLGVVKDTIVKTDKDGEFKIDFYPNRSDALIVKKNNDLFGIKYKITDYK